MYEDWGPPSFFQPYTRKAATGIEPGPLSPLVNGLSTGSYHDELSLGELSESAKSGLVEVDGGEGVAVLDRRHLLQVEEDVAHS